MNRWQVSFDERTRAHVHAIAPGLGHALLVPVVANIFSVLGVPASLTDGNFWWPIHAEPSIMPFEVEHGVETERMAYNVRQFAEVRKTQSLVVSELAGSRDIFAPVVICDQVSAILVAGPFSVGRPDSAEILRRWRWTTGRVGHTDDPEFAQYLTATFSTLSLSEAELRTFARLITCLTQLMANDGPADVLANTAEALHLELRPTRHVERVWQWVRTMLDDRFPRSWSSVAHVSDLAQMGLSRAPDHVLVGLGAKKGRERDPVEFAVTLDAFRRAAVELGRRAGDIVAAPVGDHGVVFLSAARGKAARKRDELDAFAEKAAQLARTRFGLTLYQGAHPAEGAVPLSRSFQAALAAAESALSHGKQLIWATELDELDSEQLFRLRRELADVATERPDLLPARFERYLERVAADSGYRIDSARKHLEFALERVTEALLSRGTLDERGSRLMRESLQRVTTGSETLGELFSAYRRTMSDLADAVDKPVKAHQDRNLRNGIDYIRQHYTERLPAERVARIAGFATNYFSKLFKKREGMTFERYVLGLRLDRAKQLLASTELDAQRVAELSGFHSSQYFSRVFRRELGRTPLGYRKKPERARPATRKKATHRK